MPNEENLIPFDRRPEKEQREIRSKGGKASSKVRREKKALRTYAEVLLSLPVGDEEARGTLEALGIPKDQIDNRMRLVAGLFAAACAGNVPAVKEMRSILGEDTESPLEQQTGVIVLGEAAGEEDV